MAYGKPLLSLVLTTAMMMSATLAGPAASVRAAEAAAQDMPPGEPPEGMPPGGPGGGPGGPGGPTGSGASTVTKVSVTEGDWSFDLITTTTGSEKTSTSTITYYAGKTDDVVIVPSVLGGAPVTQIAAQAFGHHGEIAAVYVPSSVTAVADWAFYDLNRAVILSFANPDVAINDAAFQSSGNAVLYLPEGTTQASAGGKAVVTAGTEPISVAVGNPSAAAIAGGAYLNITDGGSLSIGESDIAAIAKGSGGDESAVSFADHTVTFEGSPYVAAEQTVEIYKGFADQVSAGELNKRFRSLTAEQAEALNERIAKDSSFSPIKTLLQYEKGYYINGSKAELDAAATAYDVKTGESLPVNGETGLFDSTGSGYYKYITCRDTDQDGDVDVIYYSPYNVTYSYNTVTISSSNENLNGLSARDLLNPVYLSYANAVLKADGEGSKVAERSLTLDTSKDGNVMEARANQERSVLWADNYGTIQVDELHAASTSTGNWGRMSYETGLSAYNVEIVMEWGMNALLYATNGGTVKVGSLNGPTSTFSANGDGANGIIAGGTGTKGGTKEAPSDTAGVYVENAEFDLQGWNNHIADVVYGGYANLKKVYAKTGIPGSYSVGQASALANDFGNGVVDVEDFHTTVYGNRSAGAYVIGGGVITAKGSSFVSKMDAGLVSASGGTFKISGSSATGQMAFRNRGGINAKSTSTFNQVELKADRDLTGYITGPKAAQAVTAWKEASGGAELIHYMMSDAKMTIGQLCKNYSVSEEAEAALLAKLSDIAGTAYTADTPLRNSVLDNTFYNYSAGKYTGETDFADIPYLTVGSAYGGLVSSVMEFEASGINLELNDSTFHNTNGADYNYLVASEAGSEPVIRFNSSDAEGLIWNEGTVSRSVEGRGGERSSKLTVAFRNSDFTGSFADGSNGLWEVGGLSYTDAKGQASSLNGNYYGAKANWGISAAFGEGSTWTVTHDSYLGSLTLEEGAVVQAPAGYKVELTVDGVKTPMAAGTYTGEVVLRVVNDPS